jgi:hypothetical protein
MMSQKFRKPCFVILGFIVVFFLSVTAPTVQAKMSYQEMLQMADEARGSEEGVQLVISMDSIENGREQHRKMRLTAKGYNGLIDTLAPSNVKGQKFLMLERSMWFANPGLSKPIPVSPRQKFMGTAVNGDIASTNYAGDYKIVSAEEGRVNEEACLVLNLQAIDNRATYDKIKYWISKDRLVGLKAEFYTVSGKMFKKAAFEYQHNIVLNGKPREFISKMIVTSEIIKDNVSTLRYSKPLLKEVPDSFFNVNMLIK